MKRLMKAAWILAASALAFSSCVEEQALAPQDEQAGKITVNITAGSAETKTHLDGQIVDGKTQIKWDGGETIELLEQGTAFAHVTSAAGTASSDGLTAKFIAGLTSGATGPFDYYAVYPSESYPSSSNANVAEIKLVHQNVQNPTATSFDPKADLLVSQKQPAQSTQPTDLSFQFARPIAIMEMTVKGLTEGEKINSVEFSSETAILSGRMKYDFTNDKVVEYGYQGQAFKSITCKYTDYTAVNAGNKIYFTVFPTGKNPALADFTVTVDTDKATYTKTVKNLNLTVKPNELVKFSVAKLDRVAKVTDKYDLLTDASKLGEGDKILIVADPSEGTVAMAGQDGSIRATVPVTINSDKTITTLPDGIQIIELLDSKTTGEFMLRTSNNPVLELEYHGSDNDLYSQEKGSSWSITATAEGVSKISTNNNARFIQYNYNSGKDRFAAYKGTQTDVKIFYKKGTPRTALATPANLYAEQEDVNVNSATVIWDSVDNAASYTVTCGDNFQTVNAPETSSTLTSLAWSTTHTISVVANPIAGSETLKSSAAATTTVEIGVNPELKNASIKDLRTKMAESGFDIQTYCGGSMTAIFAGKTGGSCSFVDNTGEPGTGIIFRYPEGDEQLVLGQKYTINLTNAKKSSYKGLQQIEKASVIATVDAPVALVIPTITAAQLNSDDYQGMYVQIEVTTPETIGTWADTPTLTDATGNILVHCDKNATFKDVAFKANTTAIIKGIASCFNKPQLELTSEEDIDAFIDKTPAISFETTEYTANASATSLTIPFTRNTFATGDVTVTVITGGDWLKLTSATIANPGKEIACTFDANTGAERTATFTVTVAGNAVEHTITVKQVAQGQSTTKYYTKVTAAPTDWSGEYLLVGVYKEKKSGINYYAFNGKFGSWGTASQVIMTNNQIESNTTTDAYKVTISATSDGGIYTIKIGENYISASAKKKFNSKTTCTGKSEQFKISSNVDGTVMIESSDTPNREVRYNHNNGSGGFRFYDEKACEAPMLFKLN